MLPVNPPCCLMLLQMEGDAVEAVVADAEQLAAMLQPMYKELQVGTPSATDAQQMTTAINSTVSGPGASAEALY